MLCWEILSSKSKVFHNALSESSEGLCSTVRNEQAGLPMDFTIWSQKNNVNK